VQWVLVVRRQGNLVSVVSQLGVQLALGAEVDLCWLSVASLVVVIILALKMIMRLDRSTGLHAQHLPAVAPCPEKRL